MLSPLDIAVLLAFVVYSIRAGLRSREISSRSLDEYFLAGRTLPGWKAGISMAATQFAADTPLLVTGMIATAGVFALWRLWIYAISFLLMGFLLGTAWRRAGVLTDAELAELRYGGRLAATLRVAKAVYFGLVFNGMVLAMVLLAATRIAEPFLRWDDWLPAGAFDVVVAVVRRFDLLLTTDPMGAARSSANNLISLLAVVSLTALYSTTGGLRAVVNTDVLQFGAAMVATAVYAVLIVREIGGLDQIPTRLDALYGELRARQILAFDPSAARNASAIVLGTLAIQWVAQMNADGTGYLAQRMMACRSDRDARTAAIVFTFAQILLRSLVWLPIGLALLVLIPSELAPPDPTLASSREATFVAGISRFLPSGLRGLMLAGMLAALASTLDTHLNWGASYIANDLYRRLWCGLVRRREPTPRGLVHVARISNLVILAIAGFLLARLGSIQEAWKTSLLLGAGMGGPLLLRWLWWRTTASSELAAIAVSSILAPILLAWVADEGIRVMAMAVCATAAAILAAVLGPAESPERLDAFYRRVAPPGFWGPVARRCEGDASAPLRRLARGAIAVGASSLAVFFALVGLGTWMLGSPVPGWLPSRGVYVAGLLVASVSLVALTVRADRRPALRSECRR